MYTFENNKPVLFNKKEKKNSVSSTPFKKKKKKSVPFINLDCKRATSYLISQSLRINPNSNLHACSRAKNNFSSYRSFIIYCQPLRERRPEAGKHQHEREHDRRSSFPAPAGSWGRDSRGRWCTQNAPEVRQNPFARTPTEGLSLSSLLLLCPPEFCMLCMDGFSVEEER